MSSIYQSSRSIEATNQAMLLLGGLSAQSYRETGILRATGTAYRESLSLDEPSSAFLQNSEFLTKDLLAPTKNLLGPTLNALFAAGSSLLGAGVQEVSDLQAPLAVGASPAMPQRTDLPQQDPAFSDIATGSVALPPSADAATQPSAIDSPDLLSVFGVLEFLTEQIQTEPSTSAPALDGTNQEEARRQLGDGLRSVGEGLGSKLRDVFGGRIQDQSNALIDDLGIEPVSNATAPLSEVDYYNDSAAFLQSTFSSLGSASIPRIGPLLDDPQAELTRYFG